MTTIQFNKTFTQLKVFDVRAGKLFGNADHLCAKNVDGISYALAMGTKIFLLGLGATLFQLLLAFVAIYGPPELKWLSGLTYGFVLFLISQSLYPDGELIALPLCLVLATSFIGGMEGALYGVSPTVTLQVALGPVVAAPFGCLLALKILDVLMRLISRAFKVVDVDSESVWAEKISSALGLKSRK